MLDTQGKNIIEKGEWKDKISYYAQLGGIETSVLDNGTERGSRIAWINTGTGLRYKVLIDRAMDIADASWNAFNLAWINRTGVRPPQPFSNKGIDWLKTFGGGLLTTCGLAHTGGPESDEYGERGLHGDISNVPAEIISVVQPDPAMGNMQMSITGIIRETRIFGHSFELKRIISGTIGDPAIYIKDEIINRGNQPAPHMILYHFNFSWPLVDEGTDILWKGKWVPRHGEENAKIFKPGNAFQKCPAPIPDHDGAGEEVAFVDIDADNIGESLCGLYNSRLGFAVTLQFPKKQLPWFINWQHWGKNEYVTGLEPANIPPIGQAEARRRGELEFIAPGASKTYDLQLRIITNPDNIQSLLKTHTVH